MYRMHLRRVQELTNVGRAKKRSATGEVFVISMQEIYEQVKQSLLEINLINLEGRLKGEIARIFLILVPSLASSWKHITPSFTCEMREFLTMK